MTARPSGAWLRGTLRAATRSSPRSAAAARPPGWSNVTNELATPEAAGPSTRGGGWDPRVNPVAGSHPGSAELPRAARRSRRWGHFTATSSGTSVSSARSARSTSPSPRAVPGSAGVRLGLAKDAVRFPRDPAHAAANLGGDGHSSGGPGGSDGGDEQRRCGDGSDGGDVSTALSASIGAQREPRLNIDSEWVLVPHV